MDCGPTCLRMVSRHYGKHFTADTLRQQTGFGKQGVTMLGISQAAEKIGFRTRGVKLHPEQLADVTMPCILHWNQSHFVVLVAYKKRNVTVADPAHGMITYSRKEFMQYWGSVRDDDSELLGTALLLEPTPLFYKQPGDKEHKLSWQHVVKYLTQSKWQITQVMIALVITSLLQLAFPFLTQSIVDTGINTQNLRFITIILIAQLMLIFSRTIVDFIRSRLLLRISNVLNLSILSDFWIKLTRLPVSYFDTHHTGDTLQRISDHKTIQGFLTGSALSTVFSMFNFFVYAIVLITYSTPIFLVFIFGSLLYFGWIQIFLSLRRKLNYQLFYISAKENNATLQLVQGMQEVRLNNAEQVKRWEWENIQTAIFKINFKSLNYNQWQQAGAMFINQGKDVVITYMVAQLVISGQLTLGTMLAVQYIIGQLSGPVTQFVGFLQGVQDAKISMERLNEVHGLQDEEPDTKTFVARLPEEKSIHINRVSFNYPGSSQVPVLKDVTLDIPQGKMTAIVGSSGSGKTTLLKLLLKFYDQYEGDIRIADSNFKYISPSFWRKQCGAVLQDGYIFNDTIARNIAVADEIIDYDKLIASCRIANILSFIESLPNGFYTQLGAEGMGVSQGQRQRLLIARAIYKEPEYIFFDEATNALDANNERAIVENLQSFCKGRTVVVVAHRLSTVRNADKVVVLHHGKIVEEGTHDELSRKKGRYFELVKNQLELGT